MSEETTEIFKAVASGSAGERTLIFEDRARLKNFQASAKIVAKNVLSSLALSLGKERFVPSPIYKVPLDMVCDAAKPEIERLKMSQEEIFYFAFLVFNELEFGYPRAEA